MKSGERLAFWASLTWRDKNTLRDLLHIPGTKISVFPPPSDLDEEPWRDQSPLDWIEVRIEMLPDIEVCGAAPDIHDALVLALGRARDRVGMIEKPTPHIGDRMWIATTPQRRKRHSRGRQRGKA